ncbi:unnamed protein product [Didymodactylos carnosus]|uniref:Uncharacterized protein n=2 Tax=Didymodactylos carnosus TaxID=1234261 RepID=A0A8S2EI61_9BILA|nr:unnamed protein product [Didymodactylos carnosus]CAF4040488.1 unnamed protein product [Didymodactylos carnosus]
MFNLTYHQHYFGIKVNWVFSSTSHGKGPADGIGATIKSSATKHLLRHGPEESFRDVKQFYEFSLKHFDRMGLVRPSGGEPHRPIENKFLSSGTVQQMYDDKLSIRWKKLPNTGEI